MENFERNVLIDYLLGRLSPSQVEAVEQRALVDPDLAQTLETLREEIDFIDGARRSHIKPRRFFSSLFRGKDSSLERIEDSWNDVDDEADREVEEDSRKSLGADDASKSSRRTKRFEFIPKRVEAPRRFDNSGFVFKHASTSAADKNRRSGVSGTWFSRFREPLRITPSFTDFEFFSTIIAGVPRYALPERVASKNCVDVNVICSERPNFPTACLSEFVDRNGDFKKRLFSVDGSTRFASEWRLVQNPGSAFVTDLAQSNEDWRSTQISVRTAYCPDISSGYAPIVSEWVSLANSYEHRRTTSSFFPSKGKNALAYGQELFVGRDENVDEETATESLVRASSDGLGEEFVVDAAQGSGQQKENVPEAIALQQETAALSISEEEGTVAHISVVDTADEATSEQTETPEPASLELWDEQVDSSASDESVDVTTISARQERDASFNTVDVIVESGCDDELKTSEHVPSSSEEITQTMESGVSYEDAVYDSVGDEAEKTVEVAASVADLAVAPTLADFTQAFDTTTPSASTETRSENRRTVTEVAVSRSLSVESDAADLDVGPSLSAEERFLSELLGRDPTPLELEEYYWEEVDETQESQSSGIVSKSLNGLFMAITAPPVWVGRCTIGVFKACFPYGLSAVEDRKSTNRRTESKSRVSDMMISTVAGVLIAVCFVFPGLRYVVQELFTIVVQSKVRKISENVSLNPEESYLEETILPVISEHILYPHYIPEEQEPDVGNIPE